MRGRKFVVSFTPNPAHQRRATTLRYAYASREIGNRDRIPVLHEFRMACRGLPRISAWVFAACRCTFSPLPGKCCARSAGYLMREKKIGIYLMQRQRRITPLQCGIYHSFQARTLAEGEKASLQKVPPAEGVYFSQRGISSFTLGSGYAGLGNTGAIREWARSSRRCHRRCNPARRAWNPRVPGRTARACSG